jgi:peptidoglycan/LPS O-acetylase OafA/YrhL
VLQASQYNPSPKKFLGMLLTFFGKISFGVYAYHVVVLMNFDLFIDQPFNTDRLARTRVWEYFVYNFSVVAGISIILAVLTIFIIEKPINAVFKKVLTKNS